ncbi:hypothetical protein BD414DRAFT_498785 [Trametes punicea]|nr:hypothetical protein BD414DRAFT_498785 [Trametes punicea]
MDATALRKLKRTDLQKLAKRDGIRANVKTEELITGLIKKHAPGLVPYMDSIPPTSEREAISRKIMRRQGLTSLPVVAPQLRRSPRRSGAPNMTLADGESASAAVGAEVVGRANSRAREILEAPARPYGLDSSPPREDATVDAVAPTTVAGPSHHETPDTDGPMHQGAPSEGASPRAGTGHISPQDMLGEPVVLERPVRPLGVGTDPLTEERYNNPILAARPRVFFPPGETGSASMDMRAAEGRASPTCPPAGDKPSAPSTRNVAEKRQGTPRSSVSVANFLKKGTTTQAPSSATLPLAARPSLPRAAAARATAAGANVHRPPIDEVRHFLERIAPLADKDANLREQLREISVLLTVAESQTSRLKHGVRCMQRLRLALERGFFSRLKEDPSLLDGTWEPPASGPEPETQAVPTSASGQGVEAAEEGRYVGDEDSEEKEIQEVEEMTSREINSSDLPASEKSARNERTVFQEKRKRPADGRDVDDEASPRKRRRQSTTAR